MSRLHPSMCSVAIVLSLMGCTNKAEEDSSESSDTSDCGEHGDWVTDHGHCHCDDGYQLTADGNDCVPDDGGSDDGGDDGWDGDDTGETSSSFQPDSVDGTIYTESSAWVLVAKEGQTWLSIENYPSFGGATGPETRTIDSTDANYATCGVCVMVQTGCEPHGDHSHCESTFMVEAGGEVTFDELGSTAGETWSGSVADMRFIEVEINSSYESIPVEGGESLDLEYWSFDVELAAE